MVRAHRSFRRRRAGNSFRALIVPSGRLFLSLAHSHTRTRTHSLLSFLLLFSFRPSRTLIFAVSAFVSSLAHFTMPRRFRGCRCDWFFSLFSFLLLFLRITAVYVCVSFCLSLPIITPPLLRYYYILLSCACKTRYLLYLARVLKKKKSKEAKKKRRKK